MRKFYKLTNCIVLLIFVLCATSSFAAAESTADSGNTTTGNLLQNAGFEDKDGDTIPHWEAYPISVGGDSLAAIHSYDNVIAHSGSRSVYIEGLSSSTKAIWQQKVKVAPGKLYCISGFIKMSNVMRPGYCNLEIVFRDAAGACVETVNFLKHYSGDREESLWIYDFPHRVFVLSPPNADLASINLVLKGKGKAWFDDIYFGPAPTGTISGRVLNEVGKPIEGTRVFISGSDYESYTDANGIYFLHDIPDSSPRYLLIASKDGYMDKPCGDVDVAKGKATTVDFIMTEGNNVAPELRIKCGFLYRAEDIDPPGVPPEAVIDHELYPDTVLPYLLPDKFIDSQHPQVVEEANRILEKLDPEDRNNTLKVAYAAYCRAVKKYDHDSIYDNENFADTTSGKWQSLDKDGWCWGNSFHDWLYKPSEMIKENRGICIEHARLTTALLRAVGIPARTAGISQVQFWVQLPSGNGYWAATSTSKGRTSKYRVSGEFASKEEFTDIKLSELYTYSIDQGPTAHSNWYTKNKCMWHETHPWKVTYEDSMAGYNQAVADLLTFKNTGRAPKTQDNTADSRYEIAYRDLTINLSNIGDQETLIVRFPLPIESSSIDYMDKVETWTNHPECVVRTWEEDYNNQATQENSRWFSIEFDLTRLAEPNIPHYFIGVHLNPVRVNDLDRDMPKYYNLGKEMIEHANQYNIKLTLKFSAPWAEYISRSEERMAELKEWKRQGHEIAIHHHDIYHAGDWDGYTDFSEEEAIAKRIELGEIPRDPGEAPEHYVGTLDDLMNIMKKINPDMNSGVCNELEDKRSMPDEIIYSTALGCYNFGEPGVEWSSLADPMRSYNEYVSVGEVNGIDRRWIGYAHIMTREQVIANKEVFDSLNPNFVFGGVVHNSPDQAECLYDFLDFIHLKDPTGTRSMTQTEIIESGILPEEYVEISQN
jgi:hypothetical protein